ncbi:MAG: hypothetical protein Q7R92_03975 [bacterium]|nr:hypothetical protein [bacterium]
MDLKDKTPAGGKNNHPENKLNDLLKQKINSFLINYFGYLALAAAAIVLAAAGWLFIYPQYQKIAKENEIARQSLQIEYEQKASLLKSMLNLKKLYQQISEADRKKIMAMVPAGADPSGLIPEIESIALRNSVVLNSLKLEPMAAKGQPKLQSQEESGEKKEPVAGIFEQPPQGVGRVRLEVNLSSLNYPVLKNVIKTFENNVRLLDIAKINYNVSEKKAALTVYAYYLVDSR